MQERPAGWPTEGAVETIPEVFVWLPGSTWPPAMGDTPAGTGACSSWSISRDLTGGFLPGQVRGASGFSVATANVDIPQPPSPLAPWNAELSTDGQAIIYASHDGPGGDTALQLGKFRVNPISGSSTDPELSLELIEDSGRLKRPVAIKWAYTTPAAEVDSFAFDAAWVLDQVARAGGYFATPRPENGSVLSMPLVGGPACDRGTTTSSTVWQWREYQHAIGLSGFSSIIAQQSGTGVANTFFITAQVAQAGGSVQLGDWSFGMNPWNVNVRLNGVSQVQIRTGQTTNDLTWVQLWVEGAGGGTQLIIRARIDEGAWTDPVTVSLGGRSPWVSNSARVWTGSGPSNFIRAVRLDNNLPTNIMGKPTAVIDLAGSPIRGLFDMEKKSAWDLAQDVAQATLGGLWISEDGVFTYRSRHAMRGTDEAVETVEALTQIEKLTWRIDPSDVADRITVTYVPAQVNKAQDSITLWEATNPLVVRQQSTATVYADIEGTTDRLSPFLPIWDTTQAVSRFSRWAAATSAEGGGAQPADNALSFRTEIVGPSRVKITITNNTATPLWLVDGNGTPTLTLRTDVHVAPGEPVTVETGASEEDALTPLDVDCGAAVQNHDTAVEFCDWLAGQTRKALPTIEGVRVKPDLRRQQGDIIRLTDGITTLNSKAIITGISLSGDANGYTQVLDLALLEPVFLDLDRWITTEAVTTFEQWDAWLANQGFTTFEQWNRWLEIIDRS